MNSLDLALKKQRLLLESERLREKFARNGRGVQPAFQAADLAVAGLQWMKRHPEVVVGVAVAFVVARPKTVWRMGRWIYAGWGTWKPISQLPTKYVLQSDHRRSS